jgi:hypothetical protein
MALIPCPECERQISSRTPTCPQCGFPDPTGEPVAGPGEASPAVTMPTSELTEGERTSIWPTLYFFCHRSPTCPKFYRIQAPRPEDRLVRPAGSAAAMGLNITVAAAAARYYWRR